MVRTSWIVTAIFVIGVIILVLPDNGEPVLRFNKTHGPSLLDLAGLLLMLAGWLISCVVLISQRRSLTERFGRKNIYLLVGLYFLFLSGIVTALLFSLEWMLWSCVVAASLINIFFIVFAFLKNSREN